MARIETVGYKNNGAIGYSNTLQSNEFMKNERVPQGACLSFCTGRFAVLKSKTIVFYEPTVNMFNDQNNTAPTTARIMEYNSEAQNNFYLTPDLITDRVQLLYLDYKESGGGDDKKGCIVGYTADADYGMNVTAKGAYYDKVRFVTDFKYNNVCIVPKIARIAVSNSADSNYNIPVILETLTLKQFYLDNATWGELPSGWIELGYSLIFDTFPFSSGTGLFVGSEFRVNETLHVNPTEGVFNDLKLQDCYAIIDLPSTVQNPQSERQQVLLGYAGFGGYSRNYANAPTATYIGPHSIEGIQLIKWTEINGYVNDYYQLIEQGGWTTRQATIKIDIPCLNKDPFDSRLITLNDCVRMFCSLGLPIDIEGSIASRLYGNESIQDIVNGGVTDDYLYYPIIGNNGQIDTEQFAHGISEISDTNIYDKTKNDENPFDVIDEYDYNDIDTNNYVQSIELNTPPITTVGVFNRMFALSREDIDDFASFIYTTNPTEIQTILDGVQLNGEKPMDFMIGLRQFPFNIRTYATVEDDIEITFGSGVRTGVLADLIKDANVVIDLGSCTFRRYYNNFLDYEPYTTAKLYIPYCGETPVSTSEFVGHEISVKMIVDICTGTCCAVVYRDEIPYMYVNGDISAEIMITGTDSWQYIEKYKSMVLNSAQSLLGSTNQTSQTRTSKTQSGTLRGGANPVQYGTGASTVTSVSPTQVASSVLSIGDNVFEWANQGTPLYTSGTSSPLISFYKPQFCYFIIEQNLPIPVSDYGNSYGYACMRKGKLSDYDLGTLVVAANYKGQPPNATLPETLEIKQLLESGVWR